MPDTSTALTLARTITPHATTAHTTPPHHPRATDALHRLAHTWRDHTGRRLTHPTTTATGNPHPLARLIDPIPDLDQHHSDTVHLLTHLRNTDHYARVLATTALTP